MKTKKPLTPLKAIRAKCLDCCCDQTKEVQLCPCAECPLYPYRAGRDPYRKKREYSAEQKAEAAERLNGRRPTRS